jgi:hypothetical protein
MRAVKNLVSTIAFSLVQRIAVGEDCVMFDVGWENRHTCGLSGSEGVGG